MEQVWSVIDKMAIEAQL
ncbi:hypothetical protein ABR189_28935 [Chitinophaga sp. H8]|uniref:Uncharacterized protein n=1 Tax=Chitinophaga defluvii TaxID=3163343 RepID=A0ABV2TEK8_9BACT